MFAVGTILDLSVAEAAGTLAIRLDGEFDLAGVGSVENVLDRMSRPPPLTRVVFDLRELDFLDLSGLKTILRAERPRPRRRAGGRGDPPPRHRQPRVHAHPRR